MLLPTAFFAALDRGGNAVAESGAVVSTALVNDNIRSEILKISRGIAIILLMVCVTHQSRTERPQHIGADKCFDLQLHLLAGLYAQSTRR